MPLVWSEVFLAQNVPKLRHNYEENQTDKIVGNTNVQISFEYFRLFGICYFAIVRGDRRI
jgi:hypothetical protein